MSVETHANQGSQATDQLILDIKSLVLLSKSDAELRQTVEGSLLASHDEDVTKFLSLLQPKRRTSGSGFFLVALGELILASFLAIAGLAAIAPAFLGLTSPDQLINYFTQIVLDISRSGISSPVVTLLDFLIAIGLLLAAFHTLRLASINLKEAGLVSPQPSSKA